MPHSVDDAFGLLDLLACIASRPVRVELHLRLEYPSRPTSAGSRRMFGLGLANLLGCDQSNRVRHGSSRLVVLVDGRPVDRRCDMGGALEAATRQYFDFVDRKDAEALIEAGTEDIQAVDEISLVDGYAASTSLAPTSDTC